MGRATTELLCLAALLAVCSGQQLRIVTFIRARGCQLSVVVPATTTVGASILDAYLTPAFCILDEQKSLLAKTCREFDPVMNEAFIRVPVAVRSPEMLKEAREILKPLRLTSLSFLLLNSVRMVGDQTAMELDWRAGWETADLRVYCRGDSSCNRTRADFVNRFSEMFEAAAELELQLSPQQATRSQSLTLPGRIALANQSIILPTLRVPSALQTVPCTNLERHNVLRIDENCSVTILKRTDRRGYFVVEPMLCYYGNYSIVRQGDAPGAGSIVTLKLAVRSEAVLAAVKRSISNALSVTFVSVVGAELEASTPALWDWSFDPVRLAPTGDQVEVRVGCRSTSSCEMLTGLIERNPTEFWRRVRISVEARLEDKCSLQTKSTILARSTSSCGSRKAERDDNLAKFHAISGLLCLRAPYVVSVGLQVSPGSCASYCLDKRACQGFNIDNGTCQLFVFDRCSRSVRDEGCSRRGTVYVKRTPGLEPGQLCPPGYRDDRLGVKYSVNGTKGTWAVARRSCEVHGGLVTMAEVVNKEELGHIVSVMRTRSVQSVWLGGFQAPGSAEPNRGWHWVGCNDRPVDSSLWHPSEPNNSGSGENAIELGRWHTTGLNDMAENIGAGVVCKCVSPF